jgi:glycyl-tRNA synthetase beta subunit
LPGKAYAPVLGADRLYERWTTKRAGAEVGEFMRARVEAYLKDAGIPYDVADAVLVVAWDRPGVAMARARDLVRLRGDARFERLHHGCQAGG